MPPKEPAKQSRTATKAGGKGKPQAGGKHGLQARLAAAQAIANAPFVDGARLSDPDTAEQPTTAESFKEILDPKRRLFLQALSQDPRLSVACRAAGICGATGWHWRKDHGDALFQAALEKATKLGIESAESEMWRRGIKGVKKPVYHQGRLVGTVREYDTTAAIFMLKGADPEKYRENRFEVSGPGGGPMQSQSVVAVVSVEDARQRIKAALDVVEQAQQQQALPGEVVVPAVEPAKAEAVDAYAAELAKRNGGNGNGGGS